MYILFTILQLWAALSVNNILEIQKGEITYYGPSLMEQVYAKRIEYKQITPCPECIGYIAVRDRKYLNEYGYIIHPTEGLSGPYLIVDCSASKNLSAHRIRGLIAEVSYKQSRLWHMNGPIKNSTLVIVDRSN